MQVPDHLVAEIIDGEPITSPRPATPHAWTYSVLGQDLAPFNRRPGGLGGPGGWCYAREGVRNLWFIDPLARTLEAYRLEDRRWVVASTHGGDEIVRAEPFAAIEIGLERWWLDEAPESIG